MNPWLHEEGSHRNYAGRLFIKLITPYSPFYTPPPVSFSRSSSCLPSRSSRREESRSAAFSFPVHLDVLTGASSRRARETRPPFSPEVRARRDRTHTHTRLVSMRVFSLVGSRYRHYRIQTPPCTRRAVLTGMQTSTLLHRWIFTPVAPYHS